jgi:predicted  nucleic acid-binding Zn-ribbon protein
MSSLESDIQDLRNKNESYKLSMHQLGVEGLSTVMKLVFKHMTRNSKVKAFQSLLAFSKETRVQELEASVEKLQNELTTAQTSVIEKEKQSLHSATVVQQLRNKIESMEDRIAVSTIS